MKKIVKKIDKQGRVYVPKTFRDALMLNPDDELAFTLYDNKMIVQKENKRPKCHFTGEETGDVKLYGNRLLLSDEGARKLFEVLGNELDR